MNIEIALCFSIIIAIICIRILDAKADRFFFNRKFQLDEKEEAIHIREVTSMKSISKDQALTCVMQKEFGDDIIHSAENVVVILTQSWCPQWLAMRLFVSGFSDSNVYFLEYDRTDYVDIFREFKEKAFGNDQIPYIRYYRNGILTKVSNAVSEDVFRKNLGISSSQGGE